MPNGERAEGPVGGGVAVAAHDRHAGLGDPELGADDVDDALAVAAQREQRDAELGAVALERLDLGRRERVGDAGLAPDRGHVVVDRRERAVRPAHPPARQPQPVEGLRRGHLVDEVQVDEQDRRPGRVGGAHLVGVPDLLEERAARHHTALGHALAVLGVAARVDRPQVGDRARLEHVGRHRLAGEAAAVDLADARGPRRARPCRW